MTQVKICGLSTPETLTTAIDHGADFVGLVFYLPSPRHVEIEVAAYLANQVPGSVEVVGLFVDPDNKTLQQVLDSVPLTMIQLHGDETPERISDIKKTFNIPVMKALPVETSEDLKAAPAYDAVADWLLFDAKGEEIPGGNGIAFDWAILKDYRGTKPWMLAGGLTPDNVAEAVKITGAHAVDVSSGVESAPGQKDPDKIRSFLKAVKKA